MRLAQVMERDIIESCDTLKKLLLAKNQDYGASLAKKPVLVPSLTPLQSILVRMSDKINRIKELAETQSTSGKKPEFDEALEDTMVDLAGYALMFNITKKRLENVG